MADGRWQVAGGGWQVADGRWRMASSTVINSRADGLYIWPHQNELADANIALVNLEAEVSVTEGGVVDIGH